jgi:IstB-like ATP binding protein
MGSVFSDEVAAAAVIDRLLHYSTTVNIRGDSYRLRTRRGLASSTCPPPSRPPERSDWEFESGARAESVLRWGI